VYELPVRGEPERRGWSLGDPILGLSVLDGGWLSESARSRALFKSHVSFRTAVYDAVASRDKLFE
jgi:hypothetical protein